MRFRTKTIIGIGLIEATLLALLISSVMAVLARSNERELEQRVRLAGELLAGASREAVLAQDLATLEGLVDAAIASSHIDYVSILDQDGRVLAQRGDGTLLARPFHADSSFSSVQDDVFDWATPIQVKGVNYGQVRVGLSTLPLAALVESAREWAGGIALLEMALVALFSWMLGTYLTRQLVGLKDASHHVAQGDFDYRIPVRGKDELAEVTVAFNQMTATLRHRNEQLAEESATRSETARQLEVTASQLRQRGEQMAAIFALSPDGFVSFDLQGRVGLVNRTFQTILGVDGSTVLGLELEELVAVLRGKCVQARSGCLEQLMHDEAAVGAGNRGVRCLIELAQPIGRLLEIRVQRALIGHVSMVLHFRDVTFEAEIDRLKSQFLMMAAHELRTPLASIYGYSELLASGRIMSQDLEEVANVIHRQSGVLASIIDELLELSRIDAYKGSLFEMREVSLFELVQAKVAGFLVPEGRARPVLTLQDDSRVYVDVQRIGQVMEHLVDNAYRFSPGDTRVDVAVGQERGSDGEMRAVLEIRDSGIGMDQEQQKRSFERFYRADSSGVMPGLGLGMTIVYELVKLHGGRIAIVSSPGQGTSVSVSLPIV